MIRRPVLAAIGAALTLLAWRVPAPAQTASSPSVARTSSVASTLTLSSIFTPSGFQVVPTPNENFNSNLAAASASSQNDIWSVGQSTIHFDGTKWTAFPAPLINGDNTSFLGGVVDFSPRSAWAVGTTGITLGNAQQVIERWNGRKWNVFPGPTFGQGQQSSLDTMTAIAPNDMWAVGSLLQGGAIFFLFEHFDGRNWKVTTALSGGSFLLGSSAHATNDVWSVGVAGIPGTNNALTLAEHFDGSNWSPVPTPSVGQGPNQLNGVLALAANNAWAVGFSTPKASPPPGQFRVPSRTLIEHWNGSNWSVVPSPNVGPHSQFQSNRLLGLAANSPNDIWAFGSYFAASGNNEQHTLLLHWDGTRWSLEPAPNPTGTIASNILAAGVVPSPGNVWILGSRGAINTLAIHATGQ